MTRSRTIVARTAALVSLTAGVAMAVPGVAPAVASLASAHQARSAHFYDGARDTHFYDGSAKATLHIYGDGPVKKQAVSWEGG